MTKGPFAQWLSQQRGVQGTPGFVSQVELARRMDVDTSFISHLENSEKTPRPDTRAKIHAALGTSEQDLMDAGIIRPQYSRVGNAVNEAPAAYEATERREDLLAKAHALVDEVNPNYLGRVVAALELMSRAQ